MRSIRTSSSAHGKTIKIPLRFVKMLAMVTFVEEKNDHAGGVGGDSEEKREEKGEV